MRSLAHAAGIDEKVAILEWSFWSAKSDETRTIYEEILKRIVAFLPATLFGLAFMHPESAQAAVLAVKSATYLPSQTPPAILETVSAFVNIMYITENTTTKAFNKVAGKQPLTRHVSQCVSARKLPRVPHFHRSFS